MSHHGLTPLQQQQMLHVAAQRAQNNLAQMVQGQLGAGMGLGQGYGSLTNTSTITQTPYNPYAGSIQMPQQQIGPISVYTYISYVQGTEKGKWTVRIDMIQQPPNGVSESFCVYEGPFPVTDGALLEHFARLTEKALQE